MSRYSLVIPVYMSADWIPRLLEACRGLSAALAHDLEVVFVVDGSPDASLSLLREALPHCRFPSRLLALSRNFGSFAAIREGLRAATGDYFAVMAADLQEPPELVLEFFSALAHEPVDVALGKREGRADPFLTRLSAAVFWWLYRRLVEPGIPAGGVDVFGCNRNFRDRLLSFTEANSSLVGLLFWMGYRRKLVPYVRRARAQGRSAWTLKKKMKYFSDSLFAFSDLPLRLLTRAGALGLVVSVVVSAVVFVARALGLITVPGYTATVLVVSFFAALNSFGIGIVGSYVWRTFENTKGRPLAIVMEAQEFSPRAPANARLGKGRGPAV